jgi:hypothetical protein
MDKDTSLLPPPGMNWDWDDYVELDQTIFFRRIELILSPYCILSSGVYDCYFAFEHIEKGTYDGFTSALRKNGIDLPFGIVFTTREVACENRLTSYRWFICSEVEKKLNELSS